MDLYDITQCCLVCKEWNKFIEDDNYMWKEKMKEEGFEDEINKYDTKKLKMKQIFKKIHFEEESKQKTELKITAVGDTKVGKTCMLSSYCFNTFPFNYNTTVYEEHEARVMVEGNIYVLKLSDTSGDHENRELIRIKVRRTHVYLVCFSVIDPVSFENVKKFWIPEIKFQRPTVTVIIVGLTEDCYHDPKSI
eukprot:TRINITY_DN14770_c0_g1_i1.p1 TRINITY_DN14770_c0_g1~~TRINITY_DN14770_c0_g1_i1.p1  ORF type:complete len:210 (+),score=30.78 TRINITY_DN14770_c0_g1_i1:56-631(+)